jgi:serine/threonine protein phosphatase PrpC
MVWNVGLKRSLMHEQDLCPLDMASEMRVTAFGQLLFGSSITSQVRVQGKLLFGLVCDGLGGLFCGLWVPQIIMPDRLHTYPQSPLYSSPEGRRSASH